MAMVSMQEAARLAGVGRSTIYRKAEKGLLSIATMPDGSRKIDTSELYRVFPPDTPRDAPQEAEREKADMGIDKELIRLQVENEMLREMIRKAEEREIRLLDAIKLLEHRPVAQDPPTPTRSKPWWRFWG